MRLAVFFDGQAFYSGWKDRAQGVRIDFGLLADWLVDDLDCELLVGAYYYTTVGGPDRDKLVTFLDMLELQTGFFVRRLEAERNARGSEDAEAGAREGEVDTTLVVEVLTLAAQGCFDDVVLLSGRACFAPLARALQSLGKRCYVATWGGVGLSSSLRKEAYGHIDLLEGFETFRRAGLGSAEPVPTSGQAGDDFVDDLRRAQECFEGGYVGLSYFVSRWRSERLSSSPDLRRRILDDLVDQARVEIYEAEDGSKALRVCEQAAEI